MSDGPITCYSSQEMNSITNKGTQGLKWLSFGIYDCDCTPCIRFLSMIPNVNNLVFSMLVCVKMENMILSKLLISDGATLHMSGSTDPQHYNSGVICKSQIVFVLSNHIQ